MSIKEKIIHKTLWKLTELIPNRTEVIGVNNEPYLRRFHLVNRKQKFKIPFTKKEKEFVLPFAVNLHYFYRGDSDRLLHSHPWTHAFSYILTGGYLEERKKDNKIVKIHYESGDTNFLCDNDFHKITINKQKHPHTWTFFITGKRIQDYNSRFNDWGFWNHKTNTFIPQKVFLKNKNGKNSTKVSS